MNTHLGGFSLLLLTLTIVCGGSSSFPSDFIWGTATASYQVEGAYNISRGLSIWDTFSHTPGKVRHGDTGDVADDHYHRYPEDFQLMQSLGIKNYRFSISWPRLFPTGEGQLNTAGVTYYNDLINNLISHNIEPFVTLYHWDLPNDLHVNYGGWLNSSMVDYFSLYANTSFRLFGDRVKKWITFNEPLTFVNLGYAYGSHAPGRCTYRDVCSFGNSTTEPYIAAHNVLLSHAAAVNLYRQYFQSDQKGVIGITLNIDWAEPYSSSSADLAASVRHLEWQFAWYADPIFKGDYPSSMRLAVGDRLPVFTTEQQRLLNGSWDFLGVNHYTSGYVVDWPEQPGQDWNADQKLNVTSIRNGTLIGEQADSSWLFVVPWGFYKVLHWISARYNNPIIYITENGVSVPNENNKALPEVLHDQFRINYYSQYISNLEKAITDGVNVKGYFAWSLMDNFEWADGYDVRFGLVYVDFKGNLTRHPKDSAMWFSRLVTNNAIPTTTTTTTSTSTNGSKQFGVSCTTLFLMIILALFCIIC